MVPRTVRVRIFLLALALALFHFAAPNGALLAQAPAQQPAAKTPPKAPDTVPAAPVSKHFPILVIAHGNEPAWSLRLGMKGPERLDRANYPPIVLDPGETSADDPGKAWTYHAKDAATGANVSVRLFREACSDAAAEIKYTFRVVVDHAQIGTLNGCGQSMPELFPEFRKKNQLNPDDNPDANEKDKDKDKKNVLEPITNFKPPVALAYLDAAGRVILSRGAIKRTVAASGTEMSLSHDGKKLLYTRSDSKSGPERTIVLYDWDSGRSKDLVHGNVRQAFWSPNDSRVAFLNFQDQKWQVWTFPAGAPEKAAVFYPENVTALQGWVGAATVLATDLQNAYWISEDKPAQTVPLKEIYGETFQVMSSDTLRVHPLNSDLLLISAYYTNAPAGAPVDSMGLNASFFLYEIRAKRRVVLCPTDTWGRSAEWSRDGLQVFFSRLVPPKAFQNGRIFWDGTGSRRYEGASDLTVGQ
ncbi:MAG: hypothetical protein WCD68_00265 [Candidatus Acidiferrum sp.]